jgi:hypothetical protein
LPRFSALEMLFKVSAKTLMRTIFAKLQTRGVRNRSRTEIRRAYRAQKGWGANRNRQWGLRDLLQINFSRAL